MKSYEMEISMNEKDLIYDSLADINFHVLFRWEIIDVPQKNISVKEAFKVLVNRMVFKITNTK
jgi:hypothetical protein